MTRLSRCLLAVLCLLAAPLPAQDKKPDPAQLEKDFTELLTNSVLVGRFTTDGQEGTPKEDRYSIGKVGKVQGTDDSWVFTGIKYGKKDISFPIVIKVVFADGTPMMSMDEMKIEGLGTFSFRILFHGNRYAGSWQHDDHGGHMWGKVEKQKPDGAKRADEKAAEKKPGARLEDRLNRRMATIDFDRTSFQRCLEQVGEAINVRFRILDADLKAANLTLEDPLTYRDKNYRARKILHLMLEPLQLCLVVDEPRNVVNVTTRKAARERSWQMDLGDQDLIIHRLLYHRVDLDDLGGKTLAQALVHIQDRFGVILEPVDADLERAGISLDWKPEAKVFNRACLANVLNHILSPKDLCLVADEGNEVAYITTREGAVARGWQFIGLEVIEAHAAPEGSNRIALAAEDKEPSLSDRLRR